MLVCWDSTGDVTGEVYWAVLNNSWVCYYARSHIIYQVRSSSSNVNKMFVLEVNVLIQ